MSDLDVKMEKISDYGLMYKITNLNTGKFVTLSKAWTFKSTDIPLIEVARFLDVHVDNIVSAYAEMNERLSYIEEKNHDKINK